MAPVIAVSMAAGLTAATANAQMRPADESEILDAIEACRQIATPTWIELDQLAELGWYTAKKRGERRRTTVIRGVYEKQGNRAYVVVGGEELKTKSCVVLARLDSTSDYVPMVQSLAGSMGMPDRQNGPAYFWDGKDYNTSVMPSGERDAPNIRITIKALKESAE